MAFTPFTLSNARSVKRAEKVMQRRGVDGPKTQERLSLTCNRPYSESLTEEMMFGDTHGAMRLGWEFMHVRRSISMMRRRPSLDMNDQCKHS